MLKPGARIFFQVSPMGTGSKNLGDPLLLFSGTLSKVEQPGHKQTLIQDSALQVMALFIMPQHWPNSVQLLAYTCKTSESISGHEILTEDSILFLLPGHHCLIVLLLLLLFFLLKLSKLGPLLVFIEEECTLLGTRVCLLRRVLKGIMEFELGLDD